MCAYTSPQAIIRDVRLPSCTLFGEGVRKRSHVRSSRARAIRTRTFTELLYVHLDELLVPRGSPGIRGVAHHARTSAYCA